MSDPVERADIEDVLSSIRRLVSEEPARRKPAPVNEEPGKLVLTPAFRVIESDEREAVGAETDVPVESVDEADTDNVAEAETAAETWEEISLEDRIAELEAAVAGRDDEWEPDGSEVKPQNLTFDELGQTAGMPVFSHHAEVPEGEAAETQAEGEQVEAKKPSFRHSVAASKEIPQADDAGEDVAAAVTTPELTEADDDGAPEVATLEPEMRVASDWSAATPLEDSGDEVEGRTDDIREEQPEKEAANAFGLFENDTSLIDEDMLRELVSDIVREELQGALGERITRNVRKLVRREINRALASRDFD